MPWQRGFSGVEKKECAKPRSKEIAVSYRKIELTTVALIQNLLSGLPSILWEKELIRIWNRTLPEPRQPMCETVQTHTPHCMQKDQVYNKPVVYYSLYPIISRLLGHAQGQTLSELTYGGLDRALNIHKSRACAWTLWDIQSSN